MNWLRRASFATALLLMPTSLLAEKRVNPADYTLVVHVTSSQYESVEGAPIPIMLLQIVVDGKHYQLATKLMSAEVRGFIRPIHGGLLPPGDYKAKLIPHPAYKPDYLNYDVYELLMPDNRTIDGQVSAIYE